MKEILKMGSDMDLANWVLITVITMKVIGTEALCKDMELTTGDQEQNMKVSGRADHKHGEGNFTHPDGEIHVG